MLRLAGLAAVVLVTALVACSPPGSDPAPLPTPTGTTTSAQASASAGEPVDGEPPTTAATEPAPRPNSTRSPTQVDLRGIGPADVVVLPLDQWDVAVDWPQDPDGTDLGDYLDEHPEVTILTNAGIFSADLTPGGLLVADRQELRSLNLADGGGNFHLKPNAVFAVHDDGTAAVVDSTAYDPTGVVHATQSGPALLLDGERHPEFREDSQNIAIRSGVGVSSDGRTVYLAITFHPVNLWDFATLFRDELGVDDALYLDGQISQLWVDGVSDDPLPFLGPYAGVITAAPR